MSAEQYAVPTYEAPPGTAWYHFLHGNVPGHQIDFMYRPIVPGGDLAPQHFSHLARLVKYIEPWDGSAHAFALVNLSRDDTQYEPGQGGVAIVFGMRIQGAKDHAGRHAPPFSHAAAAIARELSEEALREATLALYDKLLGTEEARERTDAFYRAYVEAAQEGGEVSPILEAYVREFEDLPAPGPSGLGLRWTVEGATPPRRVSIVSPEGADFESIADCAARIAAVLLESDIRWTSISTGREADVPGGVSIRFVPVREPGAEEGTVVLSLREVPLDAAELAEALFGARAVRASEVPAAKATWRRFQEAREVPIDVEFEPAEQVKEAEPRREPRRGMLAAGLILLGVVGMIGAVALDGPESEDPRGTSAAPTLPEREVVPVPLAQAVEMPSGAVFDAGVAADAGKEAAAPPVWKPVPVRGRTVRSGSVIVVPE